MPRLKTYTVTSTLNEGPCAHTPIKEHRIILDQPQAAGGTDQGPTPVDAFLATIGSCLGTIARMVAKQQGISLQKMEFIVSGEIDVDVLLGKSSEGRAGFQSISIEANLESTDLDDESKMAFLQEVDRRCPVSETIANGTPFVFSLAAS